MTEPTVSMMESGYSLWSSDATFCRQSRSLRIVEIECREIGSCYGQLEVRGLQSETWTLAEYHPIAHFYP